VTGEALPEYGDFTIEVTATSTGANTKSLQVRALEEMELGEAVTVSYNPTELQQMLVALEQRELDQTGLIALGRTLAALLLPVTGPKGKPTIREMFGRRLLMAPDGGIRLRLRIPRELAPIPWEYAYVERAGGDGMDGFLALDRRIAFVRQEVLGSIPASAPPADLTIVAALASATGLPALDLGAELHDITEAVKGLDGVELRPVQHATFDKLTQALEGAEIFHFAGHGDFTRQMADEPGTYTGKGFLAFEDQLVDSEQFAINLRQHHVRLAVLGGCETGRREGISIWSGIAPALMKVDIPAVVANQYAITDDSAIAFSRSLYQALAGGLPLERAVSAGRIAVYNADKTGRDWGVAVLYLRGENGELFSGAADRNVRERARHEAEADIVVRTGNIKSGAIVYGARAKKILDGALAVSVTTGKVSGKVTGLKAGTFEGGSFKTRVTTGDVESGAEVVGVEIDVVGTRAGASSSKKRAKPPASPRPTSRARPPAREESAPMAGNGGGAAPGGPPGGGGGGSISVRTGDNKGAVIGSITNSTVTINPGEPEHEPFIEEKIRLDVGSPTTAVIDAPFLVMVAVKQPSAPPLSDPRVGHVTSADGSIFRTNKDDTVEYRVEISGAGFVVKQPYYVFRLRPNQSSIPYAFQVTATEVGKRTLFITAYQQRGENNEAIAQSLIEIEVQVAVQPQ
jgi:hypothetical protein